MRETQRGEPRLRCMGVNVTMRLVPAGMSKRRAGGFACAVALLMAAAGPVLAQGWPWDWGWGQQEPRRPREPVFREPPPQEQPSWQSSNQSAICLQLERSEERRVGKARRSWWRTQP